MTDDGSLPNPHDRFIRHFLAEVDHVRELVKWRLPGEVVKELDLASIEPVKGSFVNRQLRENLSDLVFHVRLAGNDREALVVLLFEHKSSPDEMTPFQVLRYMVEINHERQRNGQPLCCVIPIVLYHGPHQWKVARTVQELVDVPQSLKPFVPQFSMSLIDLSQCSDDELRHESLFLATMMLLKYIKRDELALRLPDVLRLYRQLLPPATALESLEAVLRYIISGTDRITRDGLGTLVTKALQTQGESLMPTIAEQW
ncbi:MAG: Rpn family recombination-promoting nuclease/putative transposase, partial [Pirellulaceae bacterium]